MPGRRPQARRRRTPSAALVLRLEEAARAGDAAGLRALGRDDNAVAELDDWFTGTAAARVVLKERDRTQIPSGGQRLLLEVFLGVRRRGTPRAPSASISSDQTDGWRIASASRIGNVGGLYRLSLNTAKQYDVRNLTVRAPDLTLHVALWRRVRGGDAGRPDGRDRCSATGRWLSPLPTPRKERRCGSSAASDVLKTRFDAAFIRVRPDDFADRFRCRCADRRVRCRSRICAGRGRSSRSTSARRCRSTSATSAANAGRSRRSRTTSSPRSGPASTAASPTRDRRRTRRTSRCSIGAAARTSRSMRQPKSSRAAGASTARTTSSTTTSSPTTSMSGFPRTRSFIEGSARIKLRVRSAGIATFNFRLAETLVVRGVYSPEFGRLLHLRVVNQNSLIVSLPATAVRGTELWLNVVVQRARAAAGARSRSGRIVAGSAGTGRASRRSHDTSTATAPTGIRSPR